eukprot:166974-Amphidinium_carterae.1
MGFGDLKARLTNLAMSSTGRSQKPPRRRPAMTMQRRATQLWSFFGPIMTLSFCLSFACWNTCDHSVWLVFQRWSSCNRLSFVMNIVPLLEGRCAILTPAAT